MNNRPSWDAYFMEIAGVVAKRSNCSRRKLGAILVRDNNILTTGYNGTGSRLQNCMDGGCVRCSSDVAQSDNYDNCSCIHAEQNTILFAAKNGVSILNSTLYVTGEPCFSCLKLLIQGGVLKIIYKPNLMLYPLHVRSAYNELQQQSGIDIKVFKR